jgi:hypothetical protein
MLDRVNTLTLSVQEKSKELGIIKVIAKNNGSSTKLVLNAYNKHNKRKKENHSTLQRFDGVQNKKIWAKFTYFDNDIRILTSSSFPFPFVPLQCRG